MRVSVLPRAPSIRRNGRSSPDLELEPGSGCAFWAVGPSQIASKHSRDKRLSDKKLFTVTNLELLEQLEKRVCRNRQIGSCSQAVVERLQGEQERPSGCRKVKPSARSYASPCVRVSARACACVRVSAQGRMVV
eukprot:794250-Pleurochrysis_carterae.AAC.2